MVGEFKRATAYKIKIGDIFKGNNVIEGDRFAFVELENKKLSRVNLVANVVDKFSSMEKQYISLTIDDASGQIRLKIFKDDVVKFADVNQGDTVLVIGLLRNYNEEIYIAPEIIKKQDPRYLLVRKLELDKSDSKKIDSSQVLQLSDKIISKIKNAEPDGITQERIILDLKETPEIINTEIKKYLEQGIIYEPRPGMLRYLGA